MGGTVNRESWGLLQAQGPLWGQQVTNSDPDLQPTSVSSARHTSGQPGRRRPFGTRVHSSGSIIYNILNHMPILSAIL